MIQEGTTTKRLDKNNTTTRLELDIHCMEIHRQISKQITPTIK